MLLIAAALRLVWLDLADVRFDEASALQHARGIAEGRLLPVVPFSGSVANHPPAFIYAMAPIYLFSRDVLVAIAWRALLDVAAVAVTWLIGRRYFNARVAFVAALLFAVAPWAVQFARRTWVTVLPLGSALLMMGLLEVASRRQARGWAAVGFGLTLTLGAHWAGLYLLPLVAIVAIARRDTFRPAPVLIGAMPLLLFAGAYLAYDASRDFHNARAMLGNFSNGNAAFSDMALWFALWISGGAHLSDLTGPSFGEWQRGLPPLLPYLDDAQVASLAGSTILVMELSLERRSDYPRAALWVVLASFLLPILLQLRPSRPVQIHYLLVTYPASFLLMALGADWLWQRVGAHLRPLLALAMLLLLGWQGFITFRFYDFVQHHDTSPGGYGPPLRRTLAAAALAREAVQRDQASEVILSMPGADPLVDEPATVLDVVLAQAPRRFADARHGVILREAPAVYGFAADTGLARMLWAMHFPSSEIISRTGALRTDGSQDLLFALAPAAQLPQAVTPLPAQWQGFGLLGYLVRWRDEGALVLAYVRVFEPPDVNLHWFVHAYQGETRVAQQDMSGVHPRFWRSGDILLLWFDLPLRRDAAYQLRLGAYRYPEVQNMPVLDAAGNPVDDAVTIELRPFEGKLSR